MAFLKKVEIPKTEDIEKAREKFIGGGGLVASDVEHQAKEKQEWMRMVLRIRQDAVDQIDLLIKDRMGMTRTAWILEAIQEKLNDDKNREKIS